MPQPDATGHPGQQAAAIDAGAGPGATAILQGMLETLSEVLGGLDQRLGRLEARLDDISGAGDTTAQAVARLGSGVSELVSRLDDLAAADDGPEEPVLDVAAMADTVAGRLDERLSGLSELSALSELSRLERMEERLARLGDGDAALLDAVSERMASLDGVADEVAARVAAPVDGLGDGLRVVLGRLGDLTESIDNVGSGLGALSEALADDDDGDAEGGGRSVDVAAVVAEESERIRAIVAGLGQAVTAAHADIAAAVAEEAERGRAALSAVVGEAVAAAVADAMADAVAAGPEGAERLAEEGARIRAAVAEAGPALVAVLTEETERIRAAVAEAAAERPDVAAALATLDARYEAVADALDRLAGTAEGPGVEVVERSVAAAQADLRRALDDAVLLVTDRQEAHTAEVRRAVEELRTQLAALAEGDDDGPDLATLVSEAAQSSERSVARMHADLRGALDDLARVAGERQEGPDVAAAGEQAVARMHADLRGALDEIAAVVGERHEAHTASVQQALGSLTQVVGALRGELAAVADRGDRGGDDAPEVAALLDRHGAELRQAIEAVAASIPEPPDVRGALDDALLVLADRQERGTEDLRQAIGRLRAEFAALVEADGGDDGPDVAELLARQAEAARDDLARLETVLRGQVAEVSGRAGSITDVIGRLDGRLHEVVDGVRSLSRHLEATATLVPAVEALRAEVDELRRLYEQPRLRAVNGGE